jgi:hypothetical protein
MTEQKPLISGFGPRTTAEEALAGRDLPAKMAIVTGGHLVLGWRQHEFSLTQEPLLSSALAIPRKRKWRGFSLRRTSRRT